MKQTTKHTTQEQTQTQTDVTHEEKQEQKNVSHVSSNCAPAVHGIFQAQTTHSRTSSPNQQKIIKRKQLRLQACTVAAAAAAAANMVGEVTLRSRQGRFLPLIYH